MKARKTWRKGQKIQMKENKHQKPKMMSLKPHPCFTQFLLPSAEHSWVEQPVWFHIEGFLLCHSVWELSRKSSSVFSNQRKFLLGLIRPTCQWSRHRLHFSHFNPSSSHYSTSLCPVGPLILPSHSQIPCGLNFPLGIRDKEELCSETRTCWNKSVHCSLFVCFVWLKIR